MISTVSALFYHKYLKANHPLQELSSLAVEGVGGHSIPLLGFVDTSVTVQASSSKEDLIVPILVIPNTQYNQRVPVLYWDVLSPLPSVLFLVGLEAYVSPIFA